MNQILIHRPFGIGQMYCWYVQEKRPGHVLIRIRDRKTQRNPCNTGLIWHFPIHVCFFFWKLAKNGKNMFFWFLSSPPNTEKRHCFYMRYSWYQISLFLSSISQDYPIGFLHWFLSSRSQWLVWNPGWCLANRKEDHTFLGESVVLGRFPPGSKLGPGILRFILERSTSPCFLRQVSRHTLWKYLLGCRIGRFFKVSKFPKVNKGTAPMGTHTTHMFNGGVESSLESQDHYNLFFEATCDIFTYMLTFHFHLKNMTRFTRHSSDFVGVGTPIYPDFSRIHDPKITKSTTRKIPCGTIHDQADCTWDGDESFSDLIVAGMRKSENTWAMKKGPLVG